MKRRCPEHGYDWTSGDGEHCSRCGQPLIHVDRISGWAIFLLLMVVAYAVIAGVIISNPR